MEEISKRFSSRIRDHMFYTRIRVFEDHNRCQSGALYSVKLRITVGAIQGGRSVICRVLIQWLLTQTAIATAASTRVVRLLTFFVDVFSPDAFSTFFARLLIIRRTFPSGRAPWPGAVSGWQSRCVSRGAITFRTCHDRGRFERVGPIESFRSWR